MSTQETSIRSEARAKGLRLAAKIATVGGLAVAALGLAEARAAASAAPAPTHVLSPPSDDAKTLPLEGFKVSAGGCGCAPCWGPPAPPARRARASSRRSARKRGAR